jgi:hypothetical protein
VLPNSETMSYSKLAVSAVALPCANNTSARSFLKAITGDRAVGRARGAEGVTDVGDVGIAAKGVRGAVGRTRRSRDRIADSATEAPSPYGKTNDGVDWTAFVSPHGGPIYARVNSAAAMAGDERGTFGDYPPPAGSSLSAQSSPRSACSTRGIAHPTWPPLFLPRARGCRASR